MKAEFLRRYPMAEVVSIRISEDEVVARSFNITYRAKGAQETKSASACNTWRVRRASGSFDPPLQPNCHDTPTL